MRVASGAKIAMATEEEILEFDDSLAENLQMWRQGDVQAPWEALRTLWNVEDDDVDDSWRENLFLRGTDLGVETEKELNDAQLCDLLGWAPEKGAPAAFRNYLHADPATPPVDDESAGLEGVNRLQLHWHQKVGVSAILRKTTEPPPRDKQIGKQLSSQVMGVACTALKQGWTNRSAALLADGVGTGKTSQILALIGTLIQLRECQTKNVNKPRTDLPGALQFCE